MSYLRGLPQKIRAWRKFKRAGWHPSVLQTGKIPSETYIKYSPDSTFGGRKVLNFGCGNSIYRAPNVLNVDLVPRDGVVVRDLSKPLSQFGKDFDFIIANHVLEHVPNWFDCFSEMAEILKDGGILEMWVPPVSADSAFTYRDHINRIGVLSFAGTASFRNPGCNLVVGAENEKMGDVARMAMVGHMKRPYMKWWLHFASDNLLAWFTTHLRNTVSEECFLFKKVPYAN